MNRRPAANRVLDNTVAFLMFESNPDRQMPDPIGYRDVNWLRRNPPKRKDLEELAERQYIGNPYAAMYGSRKDNPERSTRIMACVNPWAEIHVRSVFHEFGERIVAEQSDRVFAGRATRRRLRGATDPVMTTPALSRRHEQYRESLLSLLDTDPAVAVVTDIHNFYGSLRGAMVECAVLPVTSQQAAIEIRLAMEKFAHDADTRGIPVGPESSAWIAERVLHPIDLLGDAMVDIASARWSDDQIYAAGTPELLEKQFETVRALHRHLDLQLAGDKTKRSGEQGLSVEELLNSIRPSHGWLGVSIDARNWIDVSDMLLGDLEEGAHRGARIRRAMGALMGAEQNRTLTDDATPLIAKICDLLVDDPEVWECFCPRARRFLDAFADDRQREDMLALAHDLATDGFGASEQVVHLMIGAMILKRASDRPRRSTIAQGLLQIANTTECAPVRGWARHAAHCFDHELVRERVIVSGEFESLPALEQRWAFEFADPRHDYELLEHQRNHGRWPTTAAWRLSAS